jgi:branched-chain amino acid transport system substrate-binding protein
MRDAFQLAVKEEGGKLGGVPVELVIADDGLNPNTAKDIAERMLQRDGIKIFTGIIYTNVTLAIAPDLLRAGAIVIQNNTGPTELDGKGCNASNFGTAWHGEAPGESAAAAANAKGAKRLVTIVANYTSGTEQLTAFKRIYKGQVADEILVKLNQTDYAAEISQIKLRKPDGIYMFLPGGMGISFLRQMRQADVTGIPLYAATTINEAVIETLGEAAKDIVGSSPWTPDLDNAVSKKFVTSFRETYKRTPTVYAANSYDTAKLIGSALRATNGNVSNIAEVRKALVAARFDTLKGKFGFGRSQYPVSDWYMTSVVKTDAGTYAPRMVQKIMTAHGSPYADQCKL